MWFFEEIFKLIEWSPAFEILKMLYFYLKTRFNYLHIKTSTHTHTHTHINIYINIYRERETEREGERERERESGGQTKLTIIEWNRTNSIKTNENS